MTAGADAPQAPGGVRAASAATSAEHMSTGQLVAGISEQLSTLIHDEIALAQVEMRRKARAAGAGAGLFGGAGLFAVLGLSCLIAAAILGLAVVLDAWLAALIVGVLLLAVGGLAALIGRKEIAEAAPPVPSEAIDGVKADVGAIAQGARR